VCSKIQFGISTITALSPPTGHETKPERANLIKRLTAIGWLGCWTVLIFLATPLGTRPVLAEPVLTLILGQDLDGTQRFGEDLVRIWGSRNHPTTERLHIVTLIPTKARLRAVQRGRAHFTIINAETATQLMPEYPRLRVLTGLWPLYLHVLTRNTHVQSLRLPLSYSVWITENAGFVHRTLWEASRDLPQLRENLEIFPTEWIPDLMTQLQEEIIVFAAPAPLMEIKLALETDRDLRLLPIDSLILEDLRIANSWLQTQSLPGDVYPNGSVKVDWPVNRMVLIANATLPEMSVDKMNQSIHESKKAGSLFNPLFEQIDASANELLANILPFHYRSIETFRLKNGHSQDSE